MFKVKEDTTLKELYENGFMFSNNSLLYRIVNDKFIYLAFDLMDNEYCLEYTGIEMYGLCDYPNEETINKVLMDLENRNLIEKVEDK